MMTEIGVIVTDTMTSDLISHGLVFTSGLLLGGLLAGWHSDRAMGRIAAQLGKAPNAHLYKTWTAKGAAK